jgi:type I restriction enzyme S subunit
MKLGTFFENFDLLIDTLEEVAKARALILQWAIQGKLVKQDKQEEPAIIFLSKHNIKPIRFDPSNKPNGWELVFLGSLLSLQKGKKPSVLNLEGRGLPYLDIAALEHGRFIQFTEDEKCPRASIDDLIIVCDGSRSGLVLDGVEGVLGSTISKIEYIGFDRSYLRIFLTSLYSDLNSAKKGGAIPHLNIPRFLAIHAPLPPLAEQKRIVAKVDEVMTLCNKLEMQLKERDMRHSALTHAALARFAEVPAPENITLIFHESFTVEPEEIRKIILSLAYKGKLLPQRKEEGTGTELLGKIKSHYQEKKIRDKDRKNIKNYDPMNCPGVYQIPTNWAWSFLDYLCQTIVDVDHNMPKAVEKGVPFISAKDLKDDGSIDFSTPKMISEEDFIRLSRKMHIIRDDIIYSRIGARLGKARLVSVDKRFLISYSCCLIRPLHEFINKRFLLLFLDSKLALDQAKKGTQSIGVPDLGIGEIRAFNIPIPPLAEQHRIVAKVDQLMALVDQYKAQLNASREKTEQLLDAMVSELTMES